MSLTYNDGTLHGANKSKCLFAVPRIVFCGFTVSAHGVVIQPDKIKVIIK